jgi:hypothetical protein
LKRAVKSSSCEGVVTGVILSTIVLGKEALAAIQSASALYRANPQL